ncbi:MAG: AbrB/MazE/SpoVT family DNA-binding domain-containing protein [Eubacteriales bacterium]
MERILYPTSRGQITIPKEIRDILRIDENTKLKIFLDKEEIRIQVTNPLDEAVKALMTEAKRKQYKPEDIDNMVAEVREEMYNSLYGEKSND